MFDPYAHIELSVREVQEALGDENRYYCSREIGHEPSTRELLVHYINNIPPYIPITYIVAEDDEQMILFV